MPWQERTVMSERQDFVTLASAPGANIAALCRQFGISRKTGYKWLARAAQGETTFADRSRRPHTSPRITPPAVEAAVLAKRAEQPIPAPSTITAILRRHGQLATPPPPRAFVRFARGTANELGQLDFMGHRPLARGRVPPLTLLDDHSRYALLVAACANEQRPTVQAHLTAVFQCCGLPQAIRTDHGSPWGTAGMGGLSALAAWLLRLGIDVWHGRPAHPQTRGKVERFHGTSAAEVFPLHPLADLAAAQVAFDRFRACSNQERPHEALADGVPADRYQPSPRPFPAVLPEIASGPEDVVCPVTQHGSISWQGRRVFVSRGLVGQPVAVRPTAEDGRWEISFCHRPIVTIDRRHPTEV